MNIYSFFHPASGLFADRQFRGPQWALEANTPDGLQAIPGAFDPQRQRVDLASGAVVDWQPPAPPDTEFETWAWSADELVWVASRTTAAVARDARTERDRRLAACDWVVARAVDEGTPVPAAWSAYRAALRAIPQQPGFPTEIDWPAHP